MREFAAKKSSGVPSLSRSRKNRVIPATSPSSAISQTYLYGSRIRVSSAAKPEIQTPRTQQSKRMVRFMLHPHFDAIRSPPYTPLGPGRSFQISGGWNRDREG